VIRPGTFLQRAEGNTGRVVPPSGFTARLTIFSAAAMAFLAVFALALALAAGRMADRWDAALADTATIRIAAPQGQMETQTAIVQEILRTTPGVTEARVLPVEESRALLEPWFGPDLPIESLAIPQLIAVRTAAPGFDAQSLRLRLSAEAPGAVLDDHTRWRQPLVRAAARLRSLGFAAIGLIGATVAAMIVLAAQAALSANAQVITVLRLIGARDAFIARAFVRRFTLRAFGGAVAGTALGMLALALMPGDPATGAFLTDIGFHGAEWLSPLLIPPFAAITAFIATRAAALRRLKELT
jgi:cell division transport system permease protein